MIALIWACFALASPPVFEHQGRLVDHTGVSLEGSLGVDVHLLDGTGVSRWTEPDLLVLSDGFYSLRLGDTVPIPAAVAAAATHLRLVFATGAEVDARVASVPRTAVVDGAVIVATARDCTPETTGSLEWTGSALRVCDGTGWVIAGEVE